MISNTISNRICVSIAEPTLGECLAARRGLEFVEVRLDALRNLPSKTELAAIFSSPGETIATCRPGGGVATDAERKKLLLRAIEAGARYVDVEVDVPDDYKADLVARARSKGCKIILSFHDYKKTPPRGELEQIVQWCFESGVDIAKIACRVQSGQDAARLLGLLDSERKIVVVGMGAKGRLVRLLAPLLGSPFTYASRVPGKETADGQIDAATLARVLKQLEADLK